MRVVIDTSVVISAALKDRIPEEVILFVLAKPEFTWIASEEIVGEYMSVLKREKFKLPDETIQRWHNTFDRRITFVDVLNVVNFPRDQKDAKFLACALPAEADYLITGDKDFEDAHKAGIATVISVVDFRRLIVENWRVSRGEMHGGRVVNGFCHPNNVQRDWQTLFRDESTRGRENKPRPDSVYIKNLS